MHSLHSPQYTFLFHHHLLLLLLLIYLEVLLKKKKLQKKKKSRTTPLKKKKKPPTHNIKLCNYIKELVKLRYQTKSKWPTSDFGLKNIVIKAEFMKTKKVKKFTFWEIKLKGTNLGVKVENEWDKACSCCAHDHNFFTQNGFCCVCVCSLLFIYFNF